MSVTDVSKPSSSSSSSSSSSVTVGSTTFLYKSSSSTGIYEEINLKPLTPVIGLSSLLTLTVKSISLKSNDGDDDDKDENDMQRSHLLSAKIMQATNGPVPRSYLPSILVLSHEIDGTIGVDGIDGGNSYIEESPLVNDSDLSTLVEACLHWYLDSGGRITQLDLVSPTTYSGVFEAMGFDSVVSLDELSSDESAAKEYLINARGATSSGYQVLKCDVSRYMATIRNRIDQSIGQQHVQYNILGRLSHSIKAFDAAIQYYTDSLRLKPESSATFRNLGAAYHAAGNMQLAFASYQQSIQLDPTDAQVYLKLAYFYEDFASKDWIDAEVHSQQCYEYYLANVDPHDISVLTRLANLLVRENKALEAITVYDNILAIDEQLVTAWFNRAHAQLKVKDYSGARSSLLKTTELDPSISAAKHMLKALDDDTAIATSSVDSQYVKDLFSDYALDYDSHTKKMLYAAPRIIRQELSTIYKARYTTRGANGELIVDRQKIQSLKDATIASSSALSSVRLDEDECDNPFKSNEVVDFVPANTTVASSCSTYTSFMDRSLDVLDLGCGTGQAGAWLKDYARTMVGVDLSSAMLSEARRKGLYQELYELPLLEYVDSVARMNGTTFDVIVAAEVFSYIGDLAKTIQRVSSLLRPQGLFVFTVESTANEVDSKATSCDYRLLKSGRFGYDKNYIDMLIQGLGTSYSVALLKEFSPRLEAGEPIKGYMYIVQRN